MRHFAEIVNVFEELNDDFDRAIEEAGVDQNYQLYLDFEGQKRINAQAYFMLMFPQLESEVNRLCEELIRHMQTQAGWAERRAWDILDHREDRIRNIRFLNRVALLTDKGGTVYKRVKELYEARNRIAHGELLAEALDVAEIAKELRSIAAQLKGVP